MRKYPKLTKVYISITMAALFVIGGFSVYIAHASSAVLGVTQITAVQTFATADNTFADGWKWVFDVTVPTNQTVLKMKFADWVNGANIIPAGGNIQIYSEQSTNLATTNGLHDIYILFKCTNGVGNYGRIRFEEPDTGIPE